MTGQVISTSLWLSAEELAFIHARGQTVEIFTDLSGGWMFILNVKPDSHASLEQQARRAPCHQVGQMRQTNAKGVRHYMVKPAESE